MTAPSKRGPTSNKYALELQGRHCGWVTDVAGALLVGEVGAGSRGRYEELTLRCWPELPAAVWTWVAGSFAPEPAPCDGGVILADDGSLEISRLNFTGGVVTEVALPAHEAVIRDRLKVGLKFSPQGSRRSYDGGYIVGEAADTRRPAPATDPELHIDGLEEACSQVRRIESLVIRQRIERFASDEGVRVRRVGPPTVSPLVVVLAESKARGFHRWLQASEAGRSNGRSATLSVGLPAVGFTVELQQVRPLRIVEEPATDADEGRRREVRVALEIRAVQFAFAPRHVV